MKMFTVIFDLDEGEAEVHYEDSFYDSHQVTQLDCLNDAIYELTQKYNAILEDSQAIQIPKDEPNANLLNS